MHLTGSHNALYNTREHGFGSGISGAEWVWVWGRVSGMGMGICPSSLLDRCGCLGLPGAIYQGALLLCCSATLVDRRSGSSSSNSDIVLVFPTSNISSSTNSINRKAQQLAAATFAEFADIANA